MFTRLGLSITPEIGNADAVCWTGGADVNPALYGEAAIKGTFFDEERDAWDRDVWQESTNEQFKIGICRGAQLLNVLNGGRLWQDVDRHANSGHFLIDVRTGKKVFVSSTHHQMMRPGTNGEVVAIASQSTRKDSEREHWIDRGYHMDDTEVVWYPATKSLCFQPHPEMRGYKECEEYFAKLVSQFSAESQEQQTTAA